MACFTSSTHQSFSSQLIVIHVFCDGSIGVKNKEFPIAIAGIVAVSAFNHCSVLINGIIVCCVF